MGCRACINRTWRPEEGQVVNRLQEEYKKEEAKKITEEQIVDKINTPGRGESHKHAKGGIVVKGMDDVAGVFHAAVLQYRVMRSSVTSRVDVEYPFIVPIA